MFHAENKRVAWGKKLAPLLLLMLSLGVVVACGSQTATGSTGGVTPTPTSTPTPQASLPMVTITGTDFAYSQPSTFPSGLVDINFVNAGKTPHQASIVRLKDGITFAQFQADLKQQGEGALRDTATMGGPNGINPGKSAEVILNLTPGNYVTICFIRGSDNVPHFMKGMVQPFTVTNQPGAVTGPEPKADGTVSLKDFQFDLPSKIASGPMILKVTNDGTEPHEFYVSQLLPGKTLQDVIAFYQKPNGPPPFLADGGVGALDPGMTAWVKFNMTPGNYVALCFVTDPKTGKPHFMLGMAAQFSVQ